MKITGGTLRGRRVPGRPGAGTRPTSSRVREALFSMVGQQLDGARVLDPYGGTGLLSFEALSRGAAEATILERDGAALRRIRQAAAALGLSDRVTARRGSAPKDLPAGPFELILLDPPYAVDPGPVLAAVAPLASRWVVLEHSARVEPPQADGLKRAIHRRYGDTALTLYRSDPEGEPPSS